MVGVLRSHYPGSNKVSKSKETRPIAGGRQVQIGEDVASAPVAGGGSPGLVDGGIGICG